MKAGQEEGREKEKYVRCKREEIVLTLHTQRGRINKSRGTDRKRGR